MKKTRIRLVSVCVMLLLMLLAVQSEHAYASDAKMCKGTIEVLEGSITSLRISKTQAKVTWKTSNAKVAKIGGYGKIGADQKIKKTKGYKNKYQTNIIAQKAGTAMIKAVTAKKTWSCKIKVSHDWNITKQTEATEFSDGEIERTCSVCGKITSETVEYEDPQDEEPWIDQTKESVSVSFKHPAYMIKVGEMIDLNDEMVVSTSAVGKLDGNFNTGNRTNCCALEEYDPQAGSDGRYKGISVGQQEIWYTYLSKGVEQEISVYIIVTDDDLEKNSDYRYPDNDKVMFYNFMITQNSDGLVCQKQYWNSDVATSENKETALAYRTLSERLKAESKDTEDYIYHAAMYICQSVRYGDADGNNWHGLFDYGYTRCAGYAFSFYALMYYADIPVRYVESKSGYHAYNFVYLEDGWYGIDVTWMDNSEIDWDYYLASIDDITNKRNHMLDFDNDMLQLDYAKPYGTKYVHYRSSKKTSTNVCESGHTWDTGYPEGPLDCSWYGDVLYTCTTCGYQKTQYVKPKKHQYDEGVVMEAATCTHGNIMLYTCTVCGATKKDVDRELLPHDYSIIVWLRRPTTWVTDGEGIYNLKCSVCGHYDNVRHTMTYLDYIQLDQ